MIKKRTLWLLPASLLAWGTLQAGTIDQQPLFLVTSANPNVLFNMSIESPMGGAAYNDQPDGASCAGRNWDEDGKNGVSGDELNTGYCYSSKSEYLGYFDPKKCYSYSSGAFRPSSAANSDHSCSGKYSGNFMNWATMTAMDMFIYPLTGGNRVVDTKSETVVERAAAYTSTSWFPWKVANSSLNVTPSSVTPYSYGTIFLSSTVSGHTKEVWIGTGRGLGDIAQLKVRIEVCDSSVSLEGNCIGYDSGSYHKPEGLIQSKADTMRFAVTSYLKDSSQNRDGGVLRAQMKYVGPTMEDSSGSIVANPNAEYGTDGILVTDPDGHTSSTGVDYSGVINYINKFSDYGYKGYDPAGELFYESIRYFKNLSPTPEYSSSLTSTQKGGFPVLTSWNDPIQYSCQKNFIVAINDANPWLDKQLPGTHFTSGTFNGRTLSGSDYGNPGNADTDINVTALTNKVGDLEGLTGTMQCIGCTADNCDMLATNKKITALGEVMGTCPYAPKENSYYIAGLAYYANTTDIRTDHDDKQTINSFVIDTQEYGTSPLVGQMNMLWLAGKYGGFVDTNDNNEPDLTSEWDADGDGEPDNYVLATSPQKMVAGLSAAFDDIETRSSSSSAVATNSGRLGTNTKIYQARFNSTDWSGQLLAFSLKSTNGDIDKLVWDAADLIPSSRSIFTHPDTTTSARSGVAFQWGSISTAQQGLIGSSAILNYLRGDRSGEGSSYRVRGGVLGDIVNSDPLYVSNDDDYGYYSLHMSGDTSTYSQFLTGTSSNQKAGRKDVIYVGANDGMLHAFLADGVTTAGCDPDTTSCEGEELFAYVPKSVYGNLASLASASYSHKYFVDNGPQQGDAYINFDGSGSRWGTAVVGTLGGGGKGIFALDVSDPLNFGGGDVLWDLDETDTDMADLGYTFARPTIARLANGDWGVIVGNGYHSANHEAVLYILNLETGAVIRKLSTGYTGTASRTNGLSTPLVVDPDGDGIANAVYAGDLYGNMWKFDISDSRESNWSVAFSSKVKGTVTPQPLFVACADNATSCSDANRQPITISPEAWATDGGNLMILFGTGKYFESGDNTDTSQQQSFYGLQDQGSQIVRTNLVQQSILGETIHAGESVRITTETPIDLSTKSGWYIDLDDTNYPGERVVSRSIVNEERVTFATLFPETDACTYGGGSWRMSLDIFSGARPDSASTDINGDDAVTSADNATYDGNSVVVSGTKNTNGSIKLGDQIGNGDTTISFDSSTGDPGDDENDPDNLKKQVEKATGSTGRQSWIQLR